MGFLRWVGVACAGVLADGLLPGQTSKSLRASYGPKAFGAINMHRSCVAAPLRASAFSSIAAPGGSAQANHAAANTTPDALA